jgi:hypothetical protein
MGAIKRWWHKPSYAKERELMKWLLAQGAHKIDLKCGKTRICVDFISGAGYGEGVGDGAYPGIDGSTKAKDAITGKAQGPDGEAEGDGFSESELYASSG